MTLHYLSGRWFTTNPNVYVCNDEVREACREYMSETLPIYDDLREAERRCLELVVRECSPAKKAELRANESRLTIYEVEAPKEGVIAVVKDGRVEFVDLRLGA